MRAKEIENNRSDNREVDESMTITARGVVFMQDGILNPMQAIFNMPVLSDPLSKLGGIGRQGTDVEHRFMKRLVGACASPFHSNQALEPDPSSVDTLCGFQNTDDAFGESVAGSLHLMVGRASSVLLELPFNLF